MTEKEMQHLEEEEKNECFYAMVEALGDRVKAMDLLNNADLTLVDDALLSALFKMV